jgi:hypothetical protein
VRLACELILIIGLIALGWQKSFKQWTDDWRGMQQTKVMPVRQTTAVPTTTAPHQPFVNAGYPRTAPPRPQPSISNGEWMWDSSHGSSLDRPSQDFQQHPNYQDSNGRRYWIDSRGIRHYDSSPSPQ